MKKRVEFPTTIVCPHCGTLAKIRPRRDRDIFRSTCIGFVGDHRSRSLPASALALGVRVRVDVEVSAQCPLSGALVTWPGGA